MTATAAMETLDIDLALRIYRQQGDAAMVLGLEGPAHRGQQAHGCAHLSVLQYFTRRLRTF